MKTSDTLTITVDVDSLSVGALIDLEEASSTRAVCDWFTQHTNLTMDDLRALPLGEFMPLAGRVAEQVKAALQPGN